MRMLRQSGLVGSLDVTELNPLREAGGRTAGAVVGLVASLFGDAAARREAPQPEDHSWASWDLISSRAKAGSGRATTSR